LATPTRHPNYPWNSTQLEYRLPFADGFQELPTVAAYRCFAKTSILRSGYKRAEHALRVRRDFAHRIFGKRVPESFGFYQGFFGALA
jgi:hypothetical protein